MRAVRILTLNVQMFPALVRAIQGDLWIGGLLLSTLQDLLPETIAKWLGEPAADVKARAQMIADTLLAANEEDRPHVILFNELFNEDARKVMVEALKPIWPHVEEKFAEADLEDDAGLVVMSRLPFLSLADGKTRMEVFFSQDAGDDIWTSKGAGLVQVSGPLGPLTIVTTHLQSSYDFETQHRTERWSQLEEISKMLEGVYDPIGGIAVCGDLNISGIPDPNIQSSEWLDLFDDMGNSFGKLLYDTWVQMAPLGRRDGLDLGYTNRNTETGAEKRLDYHCLLRPRSSVAPELAFDQRTLAVHHARVLHRNLSDHSALEAVYQVWYPHCQPASAIDIDDRKDPAVFGDDPSATAATAATAVQISIPADDGYFWLYVPRPGTYSIFLSEGFEHQLYAANNVSDPISPADQIAYDDLPAAIQGTASRAGKLSGHRMPTKGAVVASRFPLLIAVRAVMNSKGVRSPIDGVAIILEHRGDARSTAIELVAHVTVDMPFPADQPLGTDDICWLRIRPAAGMVNKLRTEHVDISAGNGGLKLRLLDGAEAEIKAMAAQAGQTSRIDFDAQGGEALFLCADRAGGLTTGHQATYRTPLSYLRLDRAIGIRVDDETGIDWGGADEPSFQLFADEAKIFSGDWDDADSGEEWPALSANITQALAGSLVNGRSIPFVDAIGGYIGEGDGILTAATGSGWFWIDTLPPTESEKKMRESVTVTDLIKDGSYTFFATITRDP